MGSIYGFQDGYSYEAHYDYTYDCWILYVSDDDGNELSTSTNMEKLYESIDYCIYQLEQRKEK